MSPTEIQRSQPVPTSHTWECPITTPPHIQAETDKDAGVHCSPHTPPSANSTSTTPITPISSAAQQNRKTHTPDPHSHPQGPFLQATPRDLGSHAVRPTDPHTTLGLTPREGVELVTHTQLTTPPQRAPTEPLREPSTQPPHHTRTNTRGDRRTAAVGEASQNPIDTHTHELYTKPRGAHIRTRRSTLLYPKFHAENPRTPAASRTTRPPARSSHPLLLPLTTNAAGLGQAGPGRAAPVAERPGGPGRPGSSGTGVRPGPLAACPSAGPRGQASSPLPAIHAWGPRPPAGPRRSRSACVPAPGLPPRLRARETRAPAARGPGQGRVSPGARPPPSTGARPPVSPLRRSPGARGPGCHCLTLPGSRPLPDPARPGPELPPRRTYLLAQRGALRRRPLGAPGKEGQGRGPGSSERRRSSSARGRRGRRES